MKLLVLHSHSRTHTQGIPSCLTCQVEICPSFLPSSHDGRKKTGGKEKKTGRHEDQVSLFIWQIKKSINHCGPLTGHGEMGLSAAHELFMKLSPPLSLSVHLCVCVCFGWTVVGWWVRVLSEIFKCLCAFHTGPVGPQKGRRLQEEEEEEERRVTHSVGLLFWDWDVSSWPLALALTYADTDYVNPGL